MSLNTPSFPHSGSSGRESRRAHSLPAVIPAVNEMLKENKQLEQGMREILQGIQETRSNAATHTAISVPSLERLISVSDPKLTGVKDERSRQKRHTIQKKVNKMIHL